MTAKSVGGKIHMQMDEGGSSIQHPVLPKVEVGGISSLFYAMERAHRIPRDVTENGGSTTS